jgi:hypothetical protein
VLWHKRLKEAKIQMAKKIEVKKSLLQEDAWKYDLRTLTLRKNLKKRMLLWQGAGKIGSLI